MTAYSLVIAGEQHTNFCPMVHELVDPFQYLGVDPFRQGPQQSGLITHMVIKTHWGDAQPGGEGAHRQPLPIALIQQS